MNPRYREIHRAEIKRAMYRAIDQRWEALYGAFSTSIILVGFGIKFCTDPKPGSFLIGGVFFFLGALFFMMHRWLLRALRKKDQNREWLRLRDQVVITTPLGFSIFFPYGNLALLLASFLSAGVYSTWRLRQNSQPYWRLWYFRAGCAYFREIKSYSAVSKTADNQQAL